MRMNGCQRIGHDWVCVQIAGARGEQVITRGFTPRGLAFLEQHLDQLEQLYPGGVIVCDRCDQPLIEGRTRESIDPLLNPGLLPGIRYPPRRSSAFPRTTGERSAGHASIDDFR